jgi:tryptophan synthase alpha chain
LLTLASQMQRILRSGSRAFIPYLTAGFPDAERFLALLRAARGADFVEVGLPFSDPVADGPSICHASEVALRQGMHAERLFELLSREKGLPPLILMTYLNPVLAYGGEAFMERAGACGVRGILLTDLPPEDAGGLLEQAAAHDLAAVLLVSPTTPSARMHAIASRATGFLYCVAVTGTTGARAELGRQASETVRRLRKATHLPVVVGFGISTPEQVRAACRFADGVVVGSALVDLVRENADSPNLPDIFAVRLAALADAAHGSVINPQA